MFFLSFLSNLNRYISSLLGDYNQDTEEVWNTIIANNGSVQHLEFLSAHEKSVFKTAITV